MRLTVNGTTVESGLDPAMPLIFLLRDVLGLKSVKHGCGLEQCGACKVLIDGAPRHSCVATVGALDGASIETLEGFADDALRPVQRALLAHNAAQCGACLSGILIAARALFERQPRPSRAEIQAALDDHLCRCGAQPRILAALCDLARDG